MDKNISISLFRVSSDSQFLDAIFDAPAGYYMSKLEIEVKTLGADGKFISQWFDFSEALGFAEDNPRKHWSVRIPLNAIKIHEPAMYIATFGANPKLLEEEEEEQDEIVDNVTKPEDDPEYISDMAVCSDINDAYYYILDYIMEMSDRCSGLSDDAIRNYLILYAHQAAMQQHDFEIAETYFKMIINKFSKCGNGSRPGVTAPKSACNCGRR